MPINLVPASSQCLTMPAGSAGAQNRGAISLVSWIFSDVTQNANLIGYSTNNAGVPTSNTRCAMVLRTTSPVDGLECQIRAPDSGGRVDSDSNPNELIAGFWHLAAMVVNVAADTVTFYHDGVAIGTVAAVYTNAATDNTTSASGALGGEEDSAGGFYDGLLDHAMVYSRLLTQAELATMWATHGACIPYNGLLSRWLLKEGAPGVVAAATCKDSGPLQEHLTPTGSPTYAEQTFLQPRRRGI